MIKTWLAVSVIASCCGMGFSSLQGGYGIPEDLLQRVVARMDNDFGSARDHVSHPSSKDLQYRAAAGYLDELPSQVAKMYGGEPSLSDAESFQYEYDTLPEAQNPTIRDQEFLQHSSLWGNQYMTGGAGEGEQKLKPDGSLSNAQEIKTDNILPAYCNPPNPCPKGYTAEKNQCMEEFVNTAAYSRGYQSSQQCMCDTEHMFDCQESTHNSQINALARSIQSEGLVDSTLHQLAQVENTHKTLVAKKYHQKKERCQPTGESLSARGTTSGGRQKRRTSVMLHALIMEENSPKTP